jgi:hypothetical protein
VLSDLYAMGVVSCHNMLMLLAVSREFTDQERDVVVPLLMKGFQVNVLVPLLMKGFQVWGFAFQNQKSFISLNRYDTFVTVYYRVMAINLNYRA